MDKLSGLILDVYDDTEGTVLRELFSSSEEIPDMAKEAHALSAEDRSNLPDEAFALVLVNDGVELKKFATVDETNTALSVMYFSKTAHRLPEEAQSVAAENLWAACDMHGLEAPEWLKKTALSLRKVKKNLDEAENRPQKFPTHGEGYKKASIKEALNPMGLLSGALIVPQQAGEARKNLAATSGSKGAVMTPEQVKMRRAQMGMY